MKVCGVEFKANDAVISVVEDNQGMFNLPEVRVSRVALDSAEDGEALQKFQFTFAKLMQDYHIENVVIKARPMKGKFSGSAVSFKMEAAIQLIENLNIELMASNEIKAVMKKNPLPIDFKETGLKVFQEGAFTVAYAYLMQK
ncbi:DUF3010 domain-containing protein [Saccharobesus litoralis]|uniref:DUF3010 domain-containing protein n=1 Tax=Saccharobesus litoralis TaxID=2172099 RepID=A0A2S0VW46_9ALTE|nr:DUF3010 family protein [Saccharobesus litoralis]AWB68444.1 DUF3010 domain-containing protein [Saccharobesus litoralis]